MRLLTLIIPVLLAAHLAAPARADVLVLDDPLNGSTSGTRSGGSFTEGGWKITSRTDSIYWHLPHTVQKGALEFDVKGLLPNESRSGLQDKSELFHMYDWTHGNADTVYDGYRNNPYKHFIRKNGSANRPEIVDAFELLMKIEDEYYEPDSPIMNWDPAKTYRIRQEWGPDGTGRCRVTTFRKEVGQPDYAQIHSFAVAGGWDPVGHAVRIATSPRRDDWSGSPIDAVFSNIKIWDRADAAPAAPSVTWPLAGSTVSSTNPTVRWTGDEHGWYQIRITTSNDPNSGIVRDSGQVTSNQFHAVPGFLANMGTYYVFVRVRNAAGWSPWSAPGHSFKVDSSYVKPNPGIVRVVGNSLVDNNGPFLGLGTTYMSAMRKHKYYRTRFGNDLALLASRGFNYVRILTMVGWYEAWEGKEIAPVDFTNRVGTEVWAWSDYWQQFRDCVDLVYSYGMRAQVTVFADAQLMPEDPSTSPTDLRRLQHMDGVLANLAGREHKVMFLEVGNESWQNGIPSIAKLREYGQYLADRTAIPVALSSTSTGTTAELIEMYGGSAADLATEHFTRDTSEDGWLPVRDCWRAADAQGVPPTVSNEPIGPGSSVASENDPIKLVSAACFAWVAKLPAYCYHTGAGVFGSYRFKDMAGLHDFMHLSSVLPPDLASWTRNDGLQSSAPFTVYCMGQANKYWTEVPGATDGCHRNIGSMKGSEFVCYPQGIRAGGVKLVARKPMSFRVYHPMTGELKHDLMLNPGEHIVLEQGPGAYIIKGEIVTEIRTDRYFRDSAGKPAFFLGYYDWASVAPGYFIDQPSEYAAMIQQGAPYKINYIRISLGVNRFTSTTNPPSWDDRPTPVPFAYVGGRADLDQWDPVFWDGLRAQCELARQHGITAHICFFDGVELRGGSAAYRWANSFWNINNQVRNFYGNLDSNGDGGAEQNGEFYRVADFTGNTGVGYYQRRLIDKTIAETAEYANVFYEIGNELLSSPADWNHAVVEYVKARTTKPVTQNGGSKPSNIQGWAQHHADTPAQVKANVAAIVGQGYPAWEDPDGPALRAGSPDDLRRAAWYSLAGGAAGWGGFSVDFWNRAFNSATAGYYRNLAAFIEGSGVKLWNLRPQHLLVSNPGVNSCLAALGEEYVAYVLNDTNITLDLSSVFGDAYYRTYDPRTGEWGAWQTAAGSGIRTINKPAGAEDWAVHVRGGEMPPRVLTARPAWNIMIDGDPSDWDLHEFTTYIRGGQSGTGDIALVGYDEGTLYHAGYWTSASLPENAADHTARVYCRQDSGHLYFLVRCDDSDMRFANGATYNWANDCVEFYIDPGYDRGGTAMSASTSDIQLVIDARNQRNVYGCVPAYKTQVLAGVMSSVRRDATGWWLEARIDKSVLDPDIPAIGTIGIDFNFRDNDNENDMTRTTVYSWADLASGTNFPSKIPSHWGELAFEQDLCLWESFPYSNGALNGRGGWSGSAANQVTVENYAVRINGGAGSYDAVRNFSCIGEDGAAGVWARVKRGYGADTMWSLWIDDSSGRNLARWYGAGTIARGRIGPGGQVTAPQSLTGGWDELYTRIDFIADKTDFYFNGAFIGRLDHSETEAGNQIGRVRLESIDASPAAGHYVYLDEIKVGPADSEAPQSAVSAPSTAATRTGPVSYTVTFSEPVYGFNSAADVQVDASGTVGVGSVVVAVPSAGPSSGPYTVTLSAISGSGSVSVAVKGGSCSDAAGNPVAAGQPSAAARVVGSAASLADVKSLPDDTPVELADKALYLKQAGFAYIEELTRTCGIRLQGSVPSGEGDLICLTGLMKTTSGGERYILVDAMGSCGSAAVGPVGVGNRALLDELMGGLYVKTWGRVAPGSVAQDSFVISDGADGAGIKVITTGAPNVSDGEFVVISGAAGYDGVRVIYRK